MRGHEYLTLAADMQARRVVFVSAGKDASTINRLAAHLGEHGGASKQIGPVGIDMSPEFIKGVNEHLPDARLTFDKFHVVAHASKALDRVRRQQQKVDSQLKGMRWTLLKDANKLNLAQLTDLKALDFRRRHALCGVLLGWK
ncbi:Transposase [Caballeronia sp. SBC2]|nr:Transposase [Caballeronia sp. SBC2]